MDEQLTIANFEDECNILIALESYMRISPYSKNYQSYLKTYIKICNGLFWYKAKFDENGEIKIGGM